MPASETASGDAVIRLYGDTSSIGFSLAQYAARNLFAGRMFVGAGGIANLFTASRADLATNAETQTLRLSARHPNLRILCTVAEMHYRIVASRKAGITCLADLKGKRVGAIPGTSAAYYLDKMLRTVGLSDERITFVPCFRINGLHGMLQAGAIDAMAAWEPEPQRALDGMGSDAVEFQDRRVYRMIVNLHSTAEILAEPAKRQRIVQFVRALVMAAEKFRADDASVRPWVVKSTRLDEALIGRVWHNENFPGTIVPDLLDVLEVEEKWITSKIDRQPRTRAQLATLMDYSVLQDATAAGDGVLG